MACLERLELPTRCLEGIPSSILTDCKRTTYSSIGWIFAVHLPHLKLRRFRIQGFNGSQLNISLGV